MVTQIDRGLSEKTAGRVQVVDSYDARWPLVMKLIERLGYRHVLMLDEDGWLSARQSVVVAFVERRPVAFLCFHVNPVNRTCIEARLDAIGFESGKTEQLADALREGALRHAQELTCLTFKGL
jgi:hypothetical protein